MPASVLNLSGPSVSASTTVMTCERTRASSARLRRCSTSAFASGLVNARSGRRKANGSLLPSLSPSLRAVVSCTGEISAHRSDDLGISFDAGPGMVGHVLDGLRDAALGARLRQD